MEAEYNHLNHATWECKYTSCLREKPYAYPYAQVASLHTIGFISYNVYFIEFVLRRGSLTTAPFSRFKTEKPVF